MTMRSYNPGFIIFGSNNDHAAIPAPRSCPHPAGDEYL